MCEASRTFFPAHLDETERHTWCEWFRQHGVDPADVALPGWVERRELERQLAYEAYKLDEAGRIAIDPSGDQPARTVRVIQLEAAPLPWPNWWSPEGQQP